MTAQPEPIDAEPEVGWALAGRIRPRRPIAQIQKWIFTTVLVGWNLFMLAVVLSELSISHRPNTQAGVNNTVLGTMIYAWFFVNLVIIAGVLVIRWWGRRRARKAVQPTKELGTPSTVA